MRIASLLPSATEILFAIGAGPEVVGVTHECDHPAPARALPRVTSSALDHEGQPCAAIDRHIRQAVHEGSSIYRLDEPLLRDLRPDLIVTQELCEVCAVAYRQVEAAARRLPAEVPVLSLEPRSLEDIAETVTTVGAATAHEAEAERVAAELRESLALVGALPPAGTPRVACLEWTDPLMAGGHWVPEMVELAGGTDVLGHAGQPSRYVGWDEVAERQPDVVVLMPCGFSLEATLAASAPLLRDGRLLEVPAGRDGRVVAVDGSSYFNRPGPRVATGAAILAEALRAEPGAPLPAGAAWAKPGP